MSRYIDADELVRYMEERQERLKDDESLWELSVVETFLGRASSADVVEVVRCKDCKYLKPFTSQYLTGQFCECPCSFGGQGIKKPDDYCSYGERRDDREYNNSILNARKGEE